MRFLKPTRGETTCTPIAPARMDVALNFAALKSEVPTSHRRLFPSLSSASPFGSVSSSAPDRKRKEGERSSRAKVPRALSYSPWPSSTTTTYVVTRLHDADRLLYVEQRDRVATQNALLLGRILRCPVAAAAALYIAVVPLRKRLSSALIRSISPAPPLVSPVSRASHRIKSRAWKSVSRFSAHLPLPSPRGSSAASSPRFFLLALLDREEENFVSRT